MSEKSSQVTALYDGKLSSKEIGKLVGLSPRYVRRIAKRHNLERLHCGAQHGRKNHQFVSGRRIDPDGYVLVTARKDHPYARQVLNRTGKIMFEHRLVLEKKLGRYLLPSEVVDHIDGLTLHNDPENLRLFEKNGDHLRETITGRPKKISVSGMKNIRIRNRLLEDSELVDIYYLRRKRGDVRLIQILLAMLKLDKDSPFLSGTTYWLKKAQIDSSSHPKIELALNELFRRWEQDLLL